MKQSKAHRDYHLPDDFEPNLQYAVDKGLTHDEALLEFERFKLHWRGNPCRNAKKGIGKRLGTSGLHIPNMEC